MKRNIFLTFLMAFAAISIISAQNLEEILENHFDAIGQENISKVKTLKATGKAVTMGMESPFIMMNKRPGLLKLSIEFQGSQIIQAYDGETVWMINPMMGSAEPIKITGDQALGLIESSDMDGQLYNYKEKGHQLKLVGTEEVNGEEAYVMKLGKKLSFSTDRKKLEEEMLAISPEDADMIREFVRLIFGPDMMKGASLKPKKLRNFLDSIRTMAAILPLIRIFGKYNRMTIQEFSDHFKDPFLRQAVRFFIDAPGWPMKQFPMVVLSGFIKSGVTEAGAPLGGSFRVVSHIADLYKRYGGEIHFNSRVTDLIIENNRNCDSSPVRTPGYSVDVQRAGEEVLRSTRLKVAHVQDGFNGFFVILTAGRSRYISETSGNQ